MKTALITGASGFIGRHLCRHLHRQGVRTIRLDMRKHHQDCVQLDGEYIEADLVTGEGLSLLAPKRIDVVFHLAAAGVKADSRDWPGCVKVNLIGTLNLIKQLYCVRPRPVLIYAHTYYEDYVSLIPAMSENPYVMTKYAMSEVLRAFSTDYKGRIVLAKLFQIYGKGDSPNNLLPYVYSTLLKNEPVLMGSGMGLRDWLHVDDLVRGLVSCWESGGTRKFSEYDMGSGELHSIKEIVTRMAALMRKPERLLKFDSTRDRGDVSANKKAHHFPGAWHPNIDLEKGLRMIIAQYSEGSDILCGESIR